MLSRALLYVPICITLAALGPPKAHAQNSCELELEVLFDISDSTWFESLSSLNSLQAILSQALADGSLVKPPTVNLMAFGDRVYRCNDIVTTGPVTADSCYKAIAGASAAAEDAVKPTDTTDLVSVLDEIDELSRVPVLKGRRRIFVVLSDFVHDIQPDPTDSGADWESRFNNKSLKVKAQLDRFIGQTALFVKQKHAAGEETGEIINITGILGDNYLAIAFPHPHNRFISSINRYIIDDSTPLRAEIVRQWGNTFHVRIENNSCMERKDMRYSLVPFEGLGAEESLGSAPDAGIPGCPEDLQVGYNAVCALWHSNSVSEECYQHMIRLTPPETRAATEIGPISVDHCFRPRTGDIDVEKGWEGRSHFGACYETRRSRPDTWDSWRKSDLGEDKGIDFLGCISASGSLISGPITLVLRDPAGMEIAKKEIEPERFMDGSSSESERSFPVFFRLDPGRARSLCVSAHEESPSPLSLETSLKEIRLRATLKRERNSEEEEKLHDLWESSSFPLIFLLLATGWAVWGTRGGGVDALESYLGVIGVGVLAWAAAMHDASNLGDWVEDIYVKRPWLSQWGVLALGTLFLWYLALGMLDHRQGKLSAQYAYSVNSLLLRKAWFSARCLAWGVLISSLTLWGYLQLKFDPKDIEECHYTGTFESKVGAWP